MSAVVPGPTTIHDFVLSQLDILQSAAHDHSAYLLLKSMPAILPQKGKHCNGSPGITVKGVRPVNKALLFQHYCV